METLCTTRWAALAAAGALYAVAGAASAQSADEPGPAAQGDSAGDAAPGTRRAAPDAKDGPGPDGPTAEDIAKAKQAFVAGNEYFQAKDYDDAVKKFKEAYRLSKNPLLLYNIGFTLDVKKERDLALFYYKKFLDDADPQARVYDEVEARVAAMEQARSADAVFDTGSMGTPAEPAPPRAEPRGDELLHNPVEEVPPGTPVDITAVVPGDSGWQVTLYYRGAGAERFDSTVMRPRYNELVGRIPAATTTGAFVQYYLEVRGPGGDLVARSARAASPHLVLVEDGAKPRFYPDLEPGPRSQPPSAAPTPPAPRDPGIGAYQYAKWTTTGSSVGLIALWAVLNRSAASMDVSLERESAYASEDDRCPSGTPCRSFSRFQSKLQARGRRYEMLSNISLALGILSAGAAGYLWYRDLSRAPVPGDSETRDHTATFLVGDDFIGGAAAVNF